MLGHTALHPHTTKTNAAIVSLLGQGYGQSCRSEQIPAHSVTALKSPVPERGVLLGWSKCSKQPIFLKGKLSNATHSLHGRLTKATGNFGCTWHTVGKLYCRLNSAGRSTSKSQPPDLSVRVASGVALPSTQLPWTHHGLDKDLNAAMTLCARNAIKILAARAKISELDAYALCSIAVSFRVTQVVDIVRGVHALIPKSIFAPDLRREMTMV